MTSLLAAAVCHRREWMGRFYALLTVVYVFIVKRIIANALGSCAVCDTRDDDMAPTPASESNALDFNVDRTIALTHNRLMYNVQYAFSTIH